MACISSGYSESSAKIERETAKSEPSLRKTRA
jgi:hypothetical protein